jgi:hypothetical protein
VLSKLRPALTYANVMATVAVFGVFGGGAFAASSLLGAHGTVNGCVNKKTGALRVVKPGKNCSKREQRLTWNQQGPPGSQGVQGVQGVQGAPGPIAGTTAGGALSGTYPNPALATGAVTSSKLAPSAVDSSALAGGSVIAGKIGTGAVGYSELSFVKFPSFTFVFDVGSIAAHTCASIGTGIASSAVHIDSDDVVLASTSNLEDGLSMSTFVVPTTEVDVRLCNVTASAVDPASHTFRLTVFD